MGYFHALKLAFLSSLIRKYMLWEGFYHDFSTKNVSAWGGFAPWPPPRGSAPWTPARGHCPLDPRGNFAPSNDLLWRRPCILIKGLSEHTLNMYFSGMKNDPKYMFLHAFFLICASRPFQNLSIWPKTYPFSNFARFCTTKRCTRVHCLVLKNNPNYVIFFTRMISNFKYKCPPQDWMTMLTTNTSGRCFFYLAFKLNYFEFITIFARERSIMIIALHGSLAVHVLNKLCFQVNNKHMKLFIIMK